MEIKVVSIRVQTHTKKLNCNWTPDMVRDISQYQYLDPEQYMLMEIKKDIRLNKIKKIIEKSR